MPANNRYFSSILQFFTTYVENVGVADELATEAKQLLLDYLIWKKKYQSWNLAELEQFFAKKKIASRYTEPVCQILYQFVKKHPPYQTKVYLAEYLLALKNTNCSSSTIKNYKSDIDQFVDFCQPLSLEQIFKKPVLDNFYRFQEEKGLKEASITRKFSSLIQFALWLKQEGILQMPASWLQPGYIYRFDKKSANKTASDNPVAKQQPWQALIQTGKNSTSLDQNPNQPVSSSPNQNLLQKLARSLDFSAKIAKQLASKDQISPNLLPKTTNLTNNKDYLAREKNTNARSKQEQRAKFKAKFYQLSNKLHAKASQFTPNFILPYINLILIVLFFLGLGIFGYRQFFVDAPVKLAYPSTPTRPNRVLSFQGRLTDSAQNPITSGTPMQFVLYDNLTGGANLWSGSCSVNPDQDGIFAVGLGSDCGSEIDNSVFTENSNVWLEVRVGSSPQETLSPRQPIRTVAYALNAETVQGFPIEASQSATPNTILTMNSSGEIVLAETGPKIKSSDGSLTLEGKTALELRTATGSNGNIVLDADGIGGVISKDYLWAPGATLSATYAGGTALVVRGGPSGTANIMEWQTSGGTALGAINAGGNVGVGTTNPGTAKLAVMDGNVGIGTTAPTATLDVVGTGTFSEKLTLSSNTANAPLNLPRYGTANPTTTVSGDIWYRSNNLYYNDQGTIRTIAHTGSWSVIPEAEILTGTATTARFISAQRLRFTLDNATQVVGGSSANQTLTLQGNSALSGNTPSSASLIFKVGDGGLTNAMTILNNGNVGIGTTSPARLFHVNGGTGIVAQFSGRVAGGDAVNNDEFVTKLQLDSATGAVLPIGTEGQTLRYGVGGVLENVSNLFNDGTNVGIGTTSPGAKLHVEGTSIFRATESSHRVLFPHDTSVLNANLLSISSSTTESMVYAWGNDLRTLTYGNARYDATNHYFRHSNGTNWMTISSDGNVGIGTTSPAYKLEVDGTSRFSTSVRTPLLIGDSSLGIRPATNSTTAVQIQNAAGASILNVDTSNGRVGIGTTSPTAALDVIGRIYATTGTEANPSFSFTNDNDTGMHRALGSDTLGFSTGGTTRLAIVGGNIGIGTTSPAQRLDVVGNLQFSQALMPNGQAGTATHVLTSAGPGAAPTWTDPSTLGTNYWQRNSNVLSPATIADALSVGSTTPASAMFYVPGTTNNNAWFNLGTGNLGVGTTSPGAKLDVRATASGTPTLLRLHNESTWDNIGAKMQFVGHTNPWILSEIESLNAGGGQTASGILRFNTASSGVVTTKMTILPSGNVGIGTTTPTAQLQVHSGSASRITQILRGATSQTANLTEWQNSAGTTLTSVSSTGTLGVGMTPPTDSAIGAFFSDASSANISALGFTARKSSGASGGNLQGLVGNTQLIAGGSSATASIIAGLSSSVTLTGSGANSATASIVSGVRVGSPNLTAPISITGSRLYGVHILNQGNSLLTTSTGLYIESQENSTTNNYAIYTNAGNVVFNAGNAAGSNVGIGTTSPARLLHVNGGTDVVAQFSGRVVGGDAQQDNEFVTRGQVQSIALPAGTSGQTLRYNSSNQLVANSTLFNDGTNVGVGATDPGAKLDVRASASGTGNYSNFNAVGATAYSSTSGVTTNLRGLYFISGNLSATGTVTNVYGGQFRIWNNGAGPVTNSYGLHIMSPTHNGTTTNNYGLLLDSQTGATNNYAIYTNSGLNRLGDQLSIIGSADRTQNIVRGHSTQTANLTEWQNSSGTILGSISNVGVANLPSNGLVVGTNQLVVNGGNIGIGTTDSSRKFHISDSNSTVYTSPGSVRAPGVASPETSLIITNNSQTTGSGAFLELSPRNSTGSYNTSYIGVLSEAGFSGHMVFGSRSGTDAYTERMRISNAGNVGIGTTSPSALLSVGSTSQFRVDSSGDLTRIRNVAYSWPSAQGGVNTILTNNGSGTLTWTDPSTLPASVRWNEIQAPNNNLTLNHAGHLTTFNSTTATNTFFTMTANSLTSGTGLAVTSSSGSFNSTNGLLYVANTSASTNGIVARIQSNSTTGSGLTVRADGNVGIGTTNPLDVLHVEGNVRRQIGNWTSITFQRSYVNSKDNYILLFEKPVSSSGENGAIVEGSFSLHRGMSSSSNEFRQGTFIASRGYNATYRVSIPQQTGNRWSASFSEVGYSGKTYIALKFAADSHPTSGMVFDIKHYEYGTVFDSNFTARITSDDITGETPIANSTAISIRENTGSGNVGIGTTSPAYKLEVDGTSRFSTSVRTPLLIGDSSLGIRPATNSTTAVQIQNAAGTSILNVDTTNQRVGIGTTSPAVTTSILQSTGNSVLNVIATTSTGYSALHVGPTDDNSATGGYLHAFNSGYSGTGAFTPNTITLTSYLSNGLNLHSSTVNSPIRFFTGGNAAINQRMVIDGSGNVGVGTTSPSARFHINNDNLLVGAANNVVGNRTIIDANGNIEHTYGLNDGSATANRGRFLLSNNVGSKFISGNDAGGLILRNNAGRWGGVTGNHYGSLSFLVGGTSTNQIHDNYSATLAMSISGVGNVGIGTTSPAQRLDVVGNLQFSQALMPNGQAGTISHVLTSAGPGAAPTWTDPSTLGTNYWQRNSNVLSPATIADALSVGSTTPASAMFYVPGTTNNNAWFNLGTGNLGVGTTSPISALTVNSSSPILTLGNTTTNLTLGGTIDLFEAANGVYGTNAYGFRMTLDGVDNNLHFRSVNGTTLTNRMSILRDSGNVGVGTTNPGELLDVRGNIRIGGVDAGPNYIAFRGTTGDQPGSYNHGYIGERIYGGTEQSELVIFKGNDISSPSGPDRIRSIAGEIRFDTYTSALTGTFESVATNANVTNRMIITNNGNVGIGTTSPSALLSVGSTSQFRVDSSGDLTRIRNVAYSWPSAQGGANTILTNNGSGTLTWTDPSTLPASVRWNEILDPNATKSFTMGTNTTTFNFATGTGSNNLFTLSSANSANGTGSLLNVQTGTSSTVNPLRVRAGSTEALFVSSGGNVGVGTTNPQAKLNVVGTTILHGNAMVSPNLLAVSEGTQNLAPNPGFEFDDIGTTVPTGWTLQSGSVAIQAESRPTGLGQKSLYFPGDGVYNRIISNYVIPVTPGQRICGRINVKAETGSLFYFGINWVGGNWSYFFAGFSTAGEWADRSSCLTVPAGVTGAQIWFFNITGNTGAVWVDDVWVGVENATFVGNVGIGTASPAYKLEVNGTSRFSTSVRTPLLIGDSSLGIRPASNSTTAVQIQNAAGTSILNVDTTNQMVGIGTTVPNSRLSVSGRIAQTGSASSVTGYMQTNSGILASTTNLNPGILVYGGNGATNNYGMDLGYNNARWRTRLFTAGSGTDIAFGHFGGIVNPTTQAEFTELMTISGDGNVGIGTTAPSYPLNVNINTATGTNGIGLTKSDAIAGYITLQNGAGVANRFYPLVKMSAQGGNAVASTIEAQSLSTDDSGTEPIFIISSRLNTGAVGTRPVLQIKNHTAALMTIGATGSVGIGTTTPASRLHIISEEIGSGSNKGLRISNYNNTQSYSFRTGITGVNNSFLSIYDETANTNRLIINTVGNVGIGTTSPARLLHVNGGTDVVAQFSGRVVGGDAQASSEFVTLGQLSSGAGQYWQRNSNVLSPTTIADALSVGSTTPASAMFYVPGTTNNNAWFNLGTGNLGVGTVSPSEKLDIQGGNLKVGVNAAPSVGHIVFNRGGYNYVTAPSGGSIAFLTNGRTPSDANSTLVLKDDRTAYFQGGNVGVGINSPSSALHVSSTTISNSIISEQSTSGSSARVALTHITNGVERWRLSTINTNSFSVDVAGSEAIRILTNGNVGISTTNPTSKLSVSGNTTLEGGIRFDNRVTGSEARMRRYTNVANYTQRTNSATGIMVITLPTWQNLMQHIKISGYQFVGNEGAWEIKLGGYSRVAATWGSAGGAIVGNPPSMLVRVGRDETTQKHYIFLGDDTTVWRYPAVSIDVETQNYEIQDASSGWGISIESSLPTTNSVETIALSKYGYDSAIIGNVGIGTTSPEAKLQIIGSATSANSVFKVTNTATSTYLQGFELLTPNMTAGQQNYFSFGKSASTNNRAAIGYNHIADGNSSNRMSFGFFSSDNLLNILASGNVGIGTTSPTQKLDIDGQIRIRQGSPAVGRVLTSNADGVGTWTDPAGLGVRWNSIADPNGSQTLSMGAHNTTWNFTSGTFRITNSGAESLFVGGGNVGIGTTSPLTKLHIVGDVIRTNTRVTNNQLYPLGHFTPGETLFEINPTWSENELRRYFRSNSVSWQADDTAPGGYSIYIDGALNVGGVWNSGFPYIPVDENDVFYMEVWIKNAGTGQTHYMGSVDYDHNFTSLGGNPGSYGYWVMSNTNPGSNWTKVSGYISGFGSAVGQFKSGTKYWTPMALFNHGAGSGTRAAYISGWKVMKVNYMGNRFFSGNVGIGTTNAGTAKLAVMDGNVGIGTTTPTAKLSINQAEDSNQTTFTQGVGSAGLLINTGYTANSYTPGLFWNTSNNSANRPKAGIYLQLTGSGSKMFFGTSNAYGTGITNDALVIDHLGRVGIGSTSPATTFDIATTNSVINSSGNLRVYTTNTATQDFGGQINLGGSWSGTSTANFANISGRKESTANDAAGYLAFATSASGGGSLTEKMRITSVGNIGIGTTSPARLLHVNGGTDVVAQFSGRVVGGDAVNNDEFVTRGQVQSIALPAGTSGQTLRYNSSNQLVANSTLFNDGTNVGIGTTSPTSRLSVIDTRSITQGGFGLQVYSNRNRTANDQTSYAGHFSDQSSAQANANLHGLYAEAVKLSDYGNEATGILGVGKYESASGTYGSSTLKLYGVRGRTVLTGGDSNNTVGNAYSLYSEGSIASNMNLSNYYGLYISSPTGTGNIANKFALVTEAAAGNVGIGTTSPAQHLDINGNTLLSGSSRIMQISNTGTAFLYFSNSNNNISYASNQFAFNTNQSQGFTFNGGNVGIGTTNPATKLEISSGAGTGWQSNSAGSSTFRVTSTGVSALTLDATGTSGQKWTIFSAASGYSNPSGFSIYDNSAVAVRLAINNNGNVGIGPTVATAKLDIDGQIRIRQGSPAVGRVLTSNADGVGTWTDPAGLGVRWNSIADPNGSQTLSMGAHNTTWNFTSGTFRITNSGTESLFVGGGNVGVGTNSPLEKFHIVGDARISNGLQIGSQYFTNNLYHAPDGILVTTNLPTSDSRMVTLHFEAHTNSSDWGSISGTVQIRHNINNNGLIQNGVYVAQAYAPQEVRAFWQDGVLKFWVAPAGGYHNYRFRLTTQSGQYKITQITNSVMPSSGITNETVIASKTVYDNNVGIGTASPTAQLQVHSGSASRITQILRGATSQTANLTEWQNSSGTILGRVDNLGRLQIGGTNATALIYSGSTTTTNTIGNALIRSSHTISGASEAITQTQYGMFGGVNASVSGANVIADMRGFQGEAGITNAGAIVANASAVYGNAVITTGTVQGSLTGVLGGVSVFGGSVANVVGLRSGISIVSGSVTNAYGLRVDSVSGATNNFAIYTDAGLNRFGDQLSIIGSANRVQQIIRGHSSQTANLTEWQSSSGTALNVVSASGNVGIGTTAPSEKLDIDGQIRIRGGNPDTGRVLISNASGVGSWVDPSTLPVSIKWNEISNPSDHKTFDMGTYTTAFNWSTGTGVNDLFSLTSANSANGTGSLLNIQTGTSSTISPLRVRSGNAESLFVSSAGNVGIGTTNPTQKFHVKGSALIGDGVSSVEINAGNWTIDASGDFLDSAGNHTITASAGHIILSPSSNVGIGTTTPSSFKLQVNGNVGPNAHNTSNLGSTSVRWANVFGVLGNFSTSVTTPLVASGGSTLTLRPGTDAAGGGIHVQNSAGTSTILAVETWTGNVGVGTTSPSSRLQSSGATATVTPTGGSSAGSGLYITNTDTNYGMMFGVANTGRGWIQQQRSNGVNTQYDLAINPIGGNVGIGTTTPLARLDVAGAFGTGTTASRITNTTAANVNNIAQMGFVLNRTTGGLTEVAQIRGMITDIADATYKGALVFLTSTNNASPTEKWRIDANGILQSNGAQTIRTSTGNLTLATGANNGHILLSPNGTGNVGIGTTAPSTKLDVNLGSVSNNTTNFGTNVYANATTAVGYAGYNLQLDNSTANASGYLRLARTSSTTFLGMQIASQSRDGIAFLTSATSPTERWRIDANGILQSTGAQTIRTSTGNLTLATNGGNGHILLSPNGTGNVGIGTTTPGERLEIAGNFRFTQGSSRYITVQGRTTNSAGNHLFIQGGNHGGGATPVAGGNVYIDGGTGNNNNPGSILIATQVVGNVGIGTTNPIGVLDVLTPNSGTPLAASIRNQRAATGAHGLSVSIADTNTSTYILDARSNNASRLYVRADGNVGIGTTSPGETLHVNGTIATQNGNIRSYTRSNFFLAMQSDRNMVLYDSGSAIWSSGTDLSDINFKKNIAPLEDTLSTLSKLDTISFNWKNESWGQEREIGVIAQQLKEYYPMLVSRPEGGNNYLVDYPKLSVLLLQSIKEINSLINHNSIGNISMGNLGATSSAELNLAELESLAVTTTDASTGATVTRITNLSEAAIGKLKSGLATINTIIAENALITRAKIADLTTTVFNSTQATIDQLTTRRISLDPSADNLEITNKDGDLVAQIDQVGNLKIEGQLQSDEINTNNLNVIGDSQLNQLRANKANFNNLQVAGSTQLGQLTAENITTNNLVATGQTQLAQLTAESAQLDSANINTANINTTNINEATIAGTLATNNLNTNKLTAKSSRLEQLEAKLAQLEHIQAQTAEILGNATVSGQLAVHGDAYFGNDSVISGNATIAGKLKVGSLEADDIVGFREKVASAFEQPSLLASLIGQVSSADTQGVIEAVNSAGYEATSSADIQRSLAQLNLDTDDIVITPSAAYLERYLEVNGSGYIADALGVGNYILVGSGLRLGQNFMEVVASASNPSPTLYLQPSGNGSISLLAGLMSLNDDGRVVINGDVYIAGNLKAEQAEAKTLISELLQANTIKPNNFDEPLQIQVAGVATESGEIKRTSMQILDEQGIPVATISAQGKAEFAGGLGIDSEDLSASASANLVATKTTGKAKIPAGKAEVSIHSTLINHKSQIYVTPVGSTNNQVLYVKSQIADDPNTPEIEGQFTVGFDQVSLLGVEFNWWIVN